MSVAPPAADDELEILDDDDFELMIEEEGLAAVDDVDDVIDELVDDSVSDSFEDQTEASEADEPVIREPEVDVPAAEADATPSEDAGEAGEAGEEAGEEGEDGEKKGFFKKLFG